MRFFPSLPLKTYAVFLFCGLFLATAGHGSNAELALKRLNKNYNPKVHEIKGSRVNLGFCHKQDVKVRGIDPLILKARDVHTKVFTSKKWRKGDPGSRSIILIPPTGGVNPLDILYAKHFCARDRFRVVVIKGYDHQNTVNIDPSTHDLANIRNAAAVRHVLEYLGEDQVSLFGTSLGAMISSLILGIDDRVNRAVLIVGGVNLAEILSRGDQSISVRMREERMKKFNLATEVDYEKLLKKHITINQRLFASTLAKKDVLLVIANQDTTVPTKNQNDLRALFENPQVVEKDLNHLGMILHSSVWYKEKFLRFLRKP